MTIDTTKRVHIIKKARDTFNHTNKDNFDKIARELNLTTYFKELKSYEDMTNIEVLELKINLNNMGFDLV